MTFTVFVLEDHPMTRDQLVCAVQEDPDLCVVGETNALAEARAFLDRGGQADAFLIDLGLPDGNGIDLIRQLSSLPKKPIVLVITAMADDVSVFNAIEAGANGYLLKDRSNAQIAKSLHSALKGEAPISPAIAAHLLKRFRPKQDAPKVQITPREVEVLELIVRGYTFKEIAQFMDVSVNTINSHVQNLYEKLSVNSRSEAVYEAVQLGIVKI